MWLVMKNMKKLKQQQKDLSGSLQEDIASYMTRGNMAQTDKAAIRDMLKLKDPDSIVIPAIGKWAMSNPEMQWSDKTWARVLEELRRPPAIRSGRFSPSSAGRCHRRQVFAYLGAGGSTYINPNLARIFQNGTWLHRAYQGNGLEAGVFKDIEVLVDYPKFYQAGRVDAIGLVPEDHPRVEWRGLSFGCEIKGYNSFYYGRHESPRDNMPQVARYEILADFDLWSVVWDNKNTQVPKEWVFTREELEVYRDKNEEEMRSLQQSVNKKILPPLLPGAKEGINAECKDCPYSGRAGVCMTTTKDWLHA